MFGIGIGELIVILIIAFVVVGPEKLPQIARTLGKGFHELRRATDGLREEIEKEDPFSEAGLSDPSLKKGEEEDHGEAGR